MQHISLNRTCGGCTACCKTHAVSQVQTTYGEWCQHCKIGSGCTVYDQRPIDCRVYECVWLKGKGKESDRPDRLKIVMDVTIIKFDGEDVVLLNFWEVEPGAASQARVQQFTEANVAAGNAVRHRLSVPKKVSPFRVLDKIYYPAWMTSDSDRKRFIEALRAHECSQP